MKTHREKTYHTKLTPEYKAKRADKKLEKRAELAINSITITNRVNFWKKIWLYLNQPIQFGSQSL